MSVRSLASLGMTITTFAALPLLATCDKPQPFVQVATTRQLMDEVFEPAADRYWTSVGSTTDRNGTREFAPKTDAEWTAVRDAATTVAEAGNLLLIAERANGRQDWIRFAREMIQAASQARDAAAARDPKRVFDTGAELYDKCTQCHAQYLAPMYPVPVTSQPPRTPD